MLLKLRGPQSSARLKEISTHSRLPGAMLTGSQGSDAEMQSARPNNAHMMGPFSSAHSMNIAENTPMGARSPFPATSSGETSMPAMHAHLASMQDKID